jgi:UDP-N-acetylmuramate dehydrogenase
MTLVEKAHQRLTLIPGLAIRRDEPLAPHTRFGLGGPADLFVESPDAGAFAEALRALEGGPLARTVIGGGSNLIVCDEGYRGVVLKFNGGAIRAEGTRVIAEAGAELQALVDFTVARGLRGMQTMTGIPGSVGGAVYGNAGAYGHSVMEIVRKVRYADGGAGGELDNAGCEFRYRDSVFKRRKDWFIVSVEFELEAGDAAELKTTADEILEIRNRKYPQTMKCAGSIFKNCLLAELPESARREVPETVVREGKVPSAFFLEQVGAKGIQLGGIRVADYHANLIYNEGTGNAAQVRAIVNDLKARVRERFGLELEEEVQYVGFTAELPGVHHLEATPAYLENLIAELREEDLNWKPAPTRWSVSEVLAHLAHCEDVVFRHRFHAMAEEDNPEVFSYDPAIHEALELYRAPARASFAKYRKLRAENVAFLHSLSAAAAKRTARHSALGSINLGEHLHEWVFHDLGHVRQIVELVRARKDFPNLGAFQAEYKVNP